MKFIWESVDITPGKLLGYKEDTLGIAYHFVGGYNLVDIQTLELKFENPQSRAELASYINEIGAVPK